MRTATADFTGNLCFQRRDMSDDAPWRCMQPDCAHTIAPGDYFIVTLTIDFVGTLTARRWCMFHGTHVNLAQPSTLGEQP